MPPLLYPAEIAELNRLAVPTALPIAPIALADFPNVEAKPAPVSNKLILVFLFGVLFI